MGKRSKQRGRSAGWADPETEGFGSSPFAALQIDGLPSASEPAAAEPPAPEEKPGKGPARAVLRVERKGRGGKRATLVTHLGLPPEELSRWARELGKALGCRGFVEGDTIVVQGDQRDRLVTLLEQRGVRRVTRG